MHTKLYTAQLMNIDILVTSFYPNSHNALVTLLFSTGMYESPRVGREDLIIHHYPPNADDVIHTH